MHMQQLTLTNNFLLIYKQRLDVTAEKYGTVSIKLHNLPTWQRCPKSVEHSWLDYLILTTLRLYMAQNFPYLP